jgi:hypothetical protein
MPAPGRNAANTLTSRSVCESAHGAASHSRRLRVQWFTQRPCPVR